MPCRIYLRWDQHSSLRKMYSLKDSATIFAPSWVKQALQILGQRLSGVSFEIYDNSPCKVPSSRTAENSLNKSIIESFTISENFNDHSLQILQKIARNEPMNVTGKIDRKMYPDINDNALIYSIQDLVRQCAVIGRDECSNCGGYNCQKEVQEKQTVYICDLAALQFQQPYNTGRLILIHEKESYKGLLDDFIYKHVVGESKRSYLSIVNILEGKTEASIEEISAFRKRFLYHDGFAKENNPCFIDIVAYKKFVELDVVLSGMALIRMAATRGHKLHFKFLKYGTGFFAGKFQREVENEILPGVVDGLEKLFREGEALDVIKCVELPFFRRDAQSLERIQNLTTRYKIKILFSEDDALKHCPCHENEKLILATTNCGDNHAVCGNEMGFQSVDAAISENLHSKGNILCPIINTCMSEEYLNV